MPLLLRGVLLLLLALAPAATEAVGEADTALLPLTVEEPVMLPEPEPLCVAVGVPLTLIPGEVLLPGLGGRVPESKLLAEAEGSTVGLGVAAAELPRVALLLAVGEGELLPVAEALADNGPRGLPEAVALPERGAAELTVALGLQLAAAAMLLLGLLLGLGLGLAEGKGLSVARAAELLGDSEAVTDPDGLCVCSADCCTVPEGL